MGPTKPPTVAERRHHANVRALGCICCRELGEYRAAEIHHVVEGCKRLGQDAVLPLCGWHHRAEPPLIDMTVKQATELLGPSLAASKREFNARWGSERELLELVTDLVGVPA